MQKTVCHETVKLGELSIIYLDLNRHIVHLPKKWLWLPANDVLLVMQGTFKRSKNGSDLWQRNGIRSS